MEKEKLITLEDECSNKVECQIIDAFYSKETKNLNVICYNGSVYIIKININRMTYDLVSTENFFQENVDNLGTSIALSLSSIASSTEVHKSKEQWKVI